MKRTSVAAFLLLFAVGGLYPTLSAGARGAVDARTDASLAIHADAVAAASEHLAQFAMKSGHDEFVPVRAVVDELGQQHVRFAQTHKGLTVFGAQVITHRGADGRFGESTVGELAIGGLDTTPSLSPRDAIRAAKAAIGTTEGARSTELMILAANGVPTLAWRVSIHTVDEVSPHEWSVFVDASNGSVLLTVDGVHTAKGSSNAKPGGGGSTGGTTGGNGKSLYSGTVAVATSRPSRLYEMVDTTRGNKTANLNGAMGGLGTIFAKAKDTWGTGGTDSVETDAVDAHYGAEKTHDYFKNVLGRNGVWNTGEGVLSRVNYGSNYTNAFWSNSERSVVYGRGNGTTRSPYTTLDICGHEITHGLTANTAGLIYSGESGALNESFSDCFGTMVEHYARNLTAETGNWQFGEDCYTPGVAGDAFRSLSNPNGDGYTPNYYYPTIGSMNVHNASGVGNLAFYLAAHGGSNSADTSATVVAGLGNDATAKIWYRALSVYMVPTETYSQARAHTLQAAADLYGAESQQYASVAAAWTAVGVF